MKLAALTLALVACSDGAVDRGICGNGLVEPGEDCDSPDERCRECGIVCAVTADCLAYDPGAIGYVCGADELCHAPAGELEPFAEVSMPVTAFRITDVNRDRVGDLLVQSQTAVTVVFGAGSSTATILTPSALGNATFARLDDDDSLDVLMPTADGIVAFTTPFGVPSPHPFPTALDDAQGTPLRVHRVLDSPTGSHLGVFVATANDGPLAFAVFDVLAATPTAVDVGTPCNARPEDFVAGDVDVFQIGANRQLIAATLHPAGAPPQLCVFSVERVNGRYQILPIALPASPASRPVFADLRGLGCPALYVTQGTALLEYVPSIVPGCGFDGTMRTLGGAPDGARPVAAVPFAPASGGFGPVGLAMSRGIYAFRGGALEEVFTSDRTITDVQVGRFNDDDLPDLVLSSAGSVAIDVLTRTAPSPIAPVAYVPFRLDTAAPVVATLIGDFDGNALLDIAYIERRAFDDRLLVAFGTPDRPLPGVTVGTFQRVRSVILASLPDAIDRAQTISDLAVLFDAPFGSATRTQLAILHGNPQRTMIPFFDPRPPQRDRASVFRGVTVGAFGGDVGNDVFALEATGPATPTNVWLSRGATGGDLAAALTPVEAPAIRDCSLGVGSFCIDAHYTAWPIGPNAQIVIGIDSKLDAISLDPGAMQPGAPAPVRSVGKIPAPPSSEVRALETIQLDDGSHRLLVSLGPTADAADPRRAGAVDLCTFDPVTGPACSDVSDTVSAALGEGVHCVDAGFAHVAATSRFAPPARTQADLIVLCHRTGGDSLFRVSADGASVAHLLDIGAGEALEVGDVTGDGVADLVVVDRTPAVPVLRIFRQCTSRDVTCGGGS